MATTQKTQKPQATPVKPQATPVKPTGVVLQDTRPEAQPKPPVTATTPVKSVSLVPVIGAKAMQVDIGPMIVPILAKADVDVSSANQMLEQAKKKSYDALAHLTVGIVKAARNEKTISLNHVFSGDKASIRFLNDQLGVALGWKVIEGEGDKRRTVWNPALSAYFPMPGEKVQAKDTFRSNFVKQVGKCAAAALHIIEKKLDAKVDTNAGTLRISGPAVAAQFGQASVVLDERKTVGTGDKKVELNAIPSFTALRNAAAQAHGAAVRQGSNTRGAKVVTDPAQALVTIGESFVQALAKLKPEHHTAAVKAAVQKAQDAIEASGIL